jgi:hypothetical protein
MGVDQLGGTDGPAQAWLAGRACGGLLHKLTRLVRPVAGQVLGRWAGGPGGLGGRLGRCRRCLGRRAGLATGGLTGGLTGAGGATRIAGAATGSATGDGAAATAVTAATAAGSTGSGSQTVMPMASSMARWRASRFRAIVSDS